MRIKDLRFFGDYLHLILRVLGALSNGVGAIAVRAFIGELQPRAHGASCVRRRRRVSARPAFLRAAFRKASRSSLAGSSALLSQSHTLWW